MLRGLVLTFLVVFCSAAQAFDNVDARYALIVGNKGYASAPLKNPANDATAIADSLSELGFRVELLIDSDLASLQHQIHQFYADIKRDTRPRKLALLYYAGHAIQIAHDNYIVPLDMKFETHQQFMDGLFKIETLFTLMREIEGLQNILILDACRNNPFESLLLASQQEFGKGLAPVKAPHNTLIAYATEPGGIAADGAGKNGIYTKHLLKHIERSTGVEEIFKLVRAGVARETRNRQIPWEHSSLLGEVFFSPPKNKDVPDLVVF